MSLSTGRFQLISRDTNNNRETYEEEQKKLMRDLLFSSTNMAAMTSRENHLLSCPLLIINNKPWIPRFVEQKFLRVLTSRQPYRGRKQRNDGTIVGEVLFTNSLCKYFCYRRPI